MKLLKSAKSYKKKYIEKLNICAKEETSKLKQFLHSLQYPAKLYKNLFF